MVIEELFWNWFSNQTRQTVKRKNNKLSKQNYTNKKRNQIV